MSDMENVFADLIGKKKSEYLFRREGKPKKRKIKRRKEGQQADMKHSPKKGPQICPSVGDHPGDDKTKQEGLVYIDVFEFHDLISGFHVFIVGRRGLRNKELKD